MASMTAQVAMRFLALRGTPRPLRETVLYSSQRVMPWASTMWSHSERAKWLSSHSFSRPLRGPASGESAARSRARDLWVDNSVVQLHSCQLCNLKGICWAAWRARRGISR
jgi:hypothetical protein